MVDTLDCSGARTDLVRVFFFCQRFVITNQIIFYDFSSSPGEKKKRILRSGTNVYGSMKPRLVWGCGNAIGISFELKLNVFTRVLF